MEPLRDYQQDMLCRLQAAWKTHRSVLVQMPTGTGKTVIMAALLSSLGGRDGLCFERVLIVAHRRELLDQIKGTLARYGLNVNTQQPDGNYPQIMVESIQKLSRMLHPTPAPPLKGAGSACGQSGCGGAGSACGQPGCSGAGSACGQPGCGEAGNDSWKPSLVIIDEAHHALAKTYRRLWEWWPETKFLGLTATPCRLSGEAFTDLFEVLLQSWTIQEFIDKGYLSDFDYVSAAPDSLEVRRIAALDKRGADGDYQQKQMATVMDVPESVTHLYETYRQFAGGKKGIVYAISREHARHIADCYRGHGVRCAVIDSKTPVEERDRLVREYKLQTPPQAPPLEGRGAAAHGAAAHGATEHRVDVLVNVDIFGEGFDVPEVEFIQLARPTLSLSKYLQQVGRGMRVSSGKDAVTILDNVGLYLSFGLPTDERDWQQTFLGQTAGRARRQGSARPVIIREGADEKTLAALEMVCIKRRGERHEGLEVFMQGGRYGVMKDGRVTCGAKFEHIRRLRSGRYYAVATYPYEVFKGKSTVIGQAGQDLDVALYGRVTPADELLEGEDSSGRKLFWDGVGGRYYHGRPEFLNIGGVPMARMAGKYIPRRASAYVRNPVEISNIWYNDFVLWMGKVVIDKRCGDIYPVVAYGRNCFYVKNGSSYADGYLRLGLEGGRVHLRDADLRWEQNMKQTPAWHEERLVRASTGKLEYLVEGSISGRIAK